jgi:hypothetical protein
MIDPLTSAETLVAQLESLDVAPPADALTASEVRRAAIEAANRDTSATFADDVRAGKITPDNVEQRILATARDRLERDKVRQLLSELSGPLGRRARAALVADADRLVADLREPFDRAAEGIAAATFDPDADPARIVALGGDTVDVYNALADHRAALTTVQAVRQTLARWGYGPARPRVAAFIEPPGSADALAVAESILDGANRGRGGDWHALVHRGYRLRLNTADETAELIAAANAATEQAAAEADEARRAEAARRNAPYLEAWQRLGRPRDTADA